MPTPVFDNLYYAFVDELPYGRGGIAYDMSGKRNYLRRFRVIVKDKHMGEWAACAAPGIPEPGSIYYLPGGIEYDLLAISIRYRAKQEYDDDWQNWIVEVEYSTELPPGGKPDLPKDAQNKPELEPPDIDWDSEVLQIALPADLDMKAFTNSAHKPFTPAPTVEVGCTTLTISRNETSFDRVKAESYAFSVNSDTFIGATPGRAQVYPPTAKSKYRGVQRYFRVTYKIRFAPLLPDPSHPGFLIAKTWQPLIPDMGMEEWDEDKKTHRTIFTSARNKVTSPVALDGSGRRQTAVDTNGDPLVLYRNFRVYPSRSFASLIVNGLA